jgi:hypothetical protein
MPEGRSRQELGRWETLGAWLGVWTPPKGVEVPRFPARRAALGGLVLLGVIAVVAVVAVPRIDESKRESKAKERHALAARQAAERRRLVADQTPVRGTARKPAGSPAPASELKARQALLRAVERAIVVEARRRVRARTLSGRILGAECGPTPANDGRPRGETDVRVRRSAYDCLAITSHIPATGTNVAGKLGYPFRAVVDFERFAFTFCRTNPPAGERAVPNPGLAAALPRECTGP